MISRARTLGGLAAFAAAGACSTEGRVLVHEDGPAAQLDGGMALDGGTGGVPSGGATGAGGDPLFLPGSGGTAPGGAFCGSVVSVGERVPTDVLLLLDRSSAMNEPADGAGTWWSLATTALSTVLHDASLTDVQVGIQYVPESAGAPLACDALAYRTPAVEVAALSTNAMLITDSLGAPGDGADEPIDVALEGALSHMQTWAASHPAHQAGVVVVTHGEPSGCPTTTVERVVAVQTGVAGVWTRFVPLGVDLGNLGMAIPTDPALETQLLELLQGGESLLGCAYRLPDTPPETKFDANLVALHYRPTSTAAPVEIPALRTAGDCMLNANVGWYYDDPSYPSKIVLCSTSCTQVALGSLEIAVGCPPSFHEVPL